MKREIFTEFNKKEISNRERIWNVSEQYVPIYSTDLIEILQPEFQFKKLVFYKPGSTAHYFIMEYNGREVVFYNSYDRSLALRVYIKGEGSFQYPISFRRVHRGEGAMKFADDIRLYKKELIEALENISDFVSMLETITPNVELKEKIADVIFDEIKNQDKTFKCGFEDKPYSLKFFIEKCWEKYISGDYTFIKDGKEKRGRKKVFNLQKLTKINKIIKLINNEYPELVI